MKVVIVGASFAGIHCAVKIKELHPAFEVIVIEKKKQIAYIPSGLSMVLNDEVMSLDEAYFTTKEKVEQLGVEIYTETEVLAYQFQDKQLITSKGEFCYDKLVLATGSSQKSAKMFDEEEKVLTYKDKMSAQNILEKLAEVTEVVVVGAGQAGMELASGLIHQGKKVQMIETMDYPLYKYFDKDFLKSFYQLVGQLESLSFHFNETVKEIDGDKLVLSSGKEMPIKNKLVLSANSVRPDLKVFHHQLKSNSDNTVYVDDYLETSIKDVFAIGDLIQVPSFLLNANIYAPLIVNAVQTSLTCAKNIERCQEKIQPMIKTVGIKLFDVYLASTGLMESESFLYDGQIHSQMMSVPLSTIHSKEMMIKVVYDKDSYVLLGVQLMSKESILDKINTFALMIKEKVDIRDMYRLPQYYNAIFSSTSLDSFGLFEEGADWS